MDRECGTTRRGDAVSPRWAAFLLINALVLPPIAAAGEPLEREIAQILQANCATCHSEKAKTSGFSVATIETVVAGGNKYGRSVIEGHPDQSPIVKLLKGQLQPKMPMGGALADAD